jgi:hypothetical protein
MVSRRFDAPGPRKDIEEGVMCPKLCQSVVSALGQLEHTLGSALAGLGDQPLRHRADGPSLGLRRRDPLMAE